MGFSNMLDPENLHTFHAAFFFFLMHVFILVRKGKTVPAVLRCAFYLITVANQNLILLLAWQELKLNRRYIVRSQ